MSAEVIDGHFITTLNIPPTKILAAAAGKKLKTAIVIGRDEEGDLYFASSVADGGDVLWLMEIAKRELMSGCES